MPQLSRVSNYSDELLKLFLPNEYLLDKGKKTVGEIRNKLPGELQEQIRYSRWQAYAIDAFKANIVPDVMPYFKALVTHCITSEITPDSLEALLSDDKPSQALEIRPQP